MVKNAVAKDDKVRVIPLGGLGEIGKNMYIVEYKDDLIILDSGLKFPEQDMLGIDLVIPDMSYLQERKDAIRGVVLTHGHEDHIGSLPYLLRQWNVPVYGTRLTLGLVESRLRERGITGCSLNVVRPRDKVQLGCMTVEFIRCRHSIPDAVSLAVTTPAGTIIHTGDFKFDQTPATGEMTDYFRLAEYGEKGVLLLLSDSTNAERPGSTMSERAVGEKFFETFRDAPGRIIVTTFASNVDRVQQVINAAYRFNRKVAVVGRSLENVSAIATDMGHLIIPEGMLISVEEIDRYPANQVVLITTGSQGEPMSALTRMANADHRKVRIMRGDRVIVSASPIPGNERLVGKVINSLFRQGAEVIYESFAGVHVSGHASQSELELMLNLTKPRFFVPVHGEYRHLVRHAELAQDVGLSPENVFILENGDVLELTKTTATVAGKVTAGGVLVDGLGVGDVGNIVLRDRKQLSQDGILIVVLTLDERNGSVIAGPDIVSRGFVYVRESEALMDAAREKVKEAIERCEPGRTGDWQSIKGSVREALSEFLYEKTKRRPMILPIIMEV